MVTKYDVFLYLGDKNTSAKTPEIMKWFGKRNYEYSNIYRICSDLTEEGLISKTNQGFQIKLSKKSQLLYRLITYCVSNGINYNYLIDKGLADFIAKALLKIEFSSKDFDIDPKTFRKHAETLSKYGLIIKMSEKPFNARIVWNTLLANILQYFNARVLVKKEKKISILKNIENELRIFNKNVQKNERGYQSLMEDFEIKFIHSSLSLEGNPITLPDTIKILKNRIIPKNERDEDVREIQNYQIATNDMLKDSLEGNALNKDKILNYHFLAMQHNEKIAGKFRKKQVHIRGNPNFKVAHWKSIEKCLEELLEEYNKFISKKHNIKDIIRFTAYFHNQFQYIHPFADGNSRVTRLLAFHILRYFKFPVLDIPLGLLEQYLSNTKGYKKRNDDNLNETLQLIILYNLKIIDEKLF